MPLRLRSLVMVESLQQRRGLIDSCELYQRLEKLDLLKDKPYMWWPSYGSFEVLIGAILTQNSQWTRVEASLKNLEAYLSIDALCTIDEDELQTLIQPSGLFKTKAKYIKLLAQAIKDEYRTFEKFCSEVTREWLLSQKGIGPESADSILCYGCKKEAMVVDAYTHRLLKAFGYEFDSYDELQEWCIQGLSSLVSEEERGKTYALFHGMIVEYVKLHSKNKKVDIGVLK